MKKKQLDRSFYKQPRSVAHAPNQLLTVSMTPLQIGPANLHALVRAQHDRKLTAIKAVGFHGDSQPVGETRRLELLRRRGQPARTARVQVRWASITIEAPAVGCKKSWPPLTLQAVWVRELHPPAGAEPIEWMLLTDLPIRTAEEAWEKVQWYCRRWGIEEWHRALKSGCGVEQREFKTAEHLQRVLAFDLIVAWRVLACVKLGRVRRNCQLPCCTCPKNSKFCRRQ
jgi:hypothetical protein